MSEVQIRDFLKKSESLQGESFTTALSGIETSLTSVLMLASRLTITQNLYQGLKLRIKQNSYSNNI
ncbi:hypothetical protein H6F77_04745 [Microcoleus sp. FACHB-831]|uniref:hypothetical protein n=1 Tax=Microcoleus sp. FACHB-831 TaxID=2692827 RepID=UPI001687E537|nr:hypothetical protein [Microcoleus sp. FACHB-831]MBD1920428.1 hypothetical protein [Microcoleus sp. FACHB-831]